MSPLHRLRSSLLLLLCSVLLLPAIVQAQDFSIVVLPDTQNEAQFFPQVMNSQTTWIAQNASALNIKMVLGVGDIVNDGAQTAQQQNADAAIRVLDSADIPYMLAIGNHDYDGANPKSRSVTGFNQWFGPARYSGKDYYKGNFPSGSNENFYGVLTIGTQQYLFLMLEYRPRSAALDWADSILSANADKEAIVVTHSALRTNGLREDVCDTQDMPAGNANGQQLWQRLRKHSNVIMVLNGHFTGGSVAHREDIGNNGNLVNQIFADLQDFPNGGDGWLEILTFHPASNSISVQTYSPYLNQFMTGSSQQFTVPYHNPNPGTGTSTISGKVRNQSTCAAAAGVTVKAGSASAVTASDGTYKLSVPPGSYSVSASGASWNTATQPETASDSLTTQLEFYLSSASGSCTLNSTSPSVTICTPANNATVSSPVAVQAGTTDSHAVSFIQAYVDGKSAVTQNGGTLNASIPMSNGTHRLTVQAKDSAGTIFKQSISINVGTVSPTPTPTPTPSPTPTPTPTPTPGTCNPGPTSPSVTICSPLNGATVNSPVHVQAATRDSVAVSFIQIYVDGKAVFTTSGGAVDTSLAMSNGTHRLTVQAKDSAGVVFKQSISVNVGTASPTPTPSPTPSPSPTPDTCSPGSISPSVTICSPLNGASVSSPVHVQAVARDSVAVSFVQIYVDGKAVFTTGGGTVDTSVAMAAGAHRVTVQAKDSSGVIFKQTVSITVQ